MLGLKGLPAFGGASSVGENLLNYLKSDYQFTVYSTSSHTHLKKGNYNGIYQIVFKKIPLKKINTLYYYIISAIHIMVKGKYDLIHMHHRDAAFLIPFLKLRFRVILTTHGSFYVCHKWKKYELFFKMNENFFVKYANIITCVSRQETREYNNLLNIKTIFIPNGIKVKAGISEARENYLFFGAGRIIKTKGLEVLLIALSKLKIKYKLLVAGDLEQTPKYKREILELSKEVNVEYLGLIKDKKELEGYLRKAKLFIFPSSHEAMSMMLLEAISQNVPSIISDITQNRDIFDDDEVLFFRSGDPLDLANKIEWALGSYHIMLTMTNKALKKLSVDYNWQTISNMYSNLYKKLII